MNISYQWLKDYVATDLSPEGVAKALTSIGLETGGIEVYDSIEGGLRGLVIGQVLTCEPHSNSDHLSVTTVSIGEGTEPLQIVCGAPNVRAGVAVVVATVGTVLGSGEEQFTIKKSKIRGVESYGMLCSEVEIGVGADNSGIILLDPASVRIGMPAAEYFGVESDHVLEVDITPNRVDATSHYGVARDLAAYLSQHVASTQAVLPSVQALAQGTCPCPIRVEASEELVPRFQGVVIRGLQVGQSPEWLRRRLESIGQKPINVVVDVTNYVLHELGQPLHAYDLDQVVGGLVVRTATEGSTVVTLDKQERTLTESDIIIADQADTPLCIAGVMGALGSGTTEATTSVLLESANFHASSVRRTARRLGLSSDSSFRFERGLDPERTHFALERAVSLILVLCPGAYVDGGVSDHYPAPSQPHRVELSLRRMRLLVGKELPQAEVLSILKSLEIELLEQGEDVWTLSVPRYRIDVCRDVDVVEEILRIYGYNNVELSGYIHASLSPEGEADRSYKRKLMLSEQLVGAGYSEILNNSLTAEAYYADLTSYPAEKLVRLVNPLSNELGVMRQSLLFGGLSSIGRNLRRQQKSCYFFEWGNCYWYEAPAEGSEPSMKQYKEAQRLGLWATGQRVQGSWAHANEATSAFELKAQVEHILGRLGIAEKNIRLSQVEWDVCVAQSLEVRTGAGKLIGRLGQVKPSLLQAHEIDLPVYYVELEWSTLQTEAERVGLTARDLPKYPVVKRDLSLLIDESTTMADIVAIAKRTEKKLLLRCELFDVYEGKNLPAGKKSYAVSFFFQDEERTMSDSQIEGIMRKLQQTLEKELGAQLR